MKILAQDVLNEISSPDDLDRVLDLSIDDALSIALNKSEHQILDTAWYEKLLNKLGDIEQDAFTMGLATNEIEVTAMKRDPRLHELKQHFIALANTQGCVYEDDYHSACYDLNPRLINDVNTWLISAGLPLKRNPSKLDRKLDTEYKKKVKKVVEKPDINKLKKGELTTSLKLNKIIKDLKLPECESEFLPPWKKINKQAQRIDDEKRQLEDTIRSRQSQIPNWKDLLKKVRNAFDFSELRQVWEDVKMLPAFATKVSFHNTHFDAITVNTPEEYAQGLEVVSSLAPEQGMLFPFEPPSHVTFHMGKVTFPIDILFLMESPMGLKVSKIIHNAQPGSVTNWSAPKTRYVLELAGKVCKTKNIKIGSICRILLGKDGK